MNNRYKTLFAVLIAAVVGVLSGCDDSQFVIGNTFPSSMSYAEFTNDTYMRTATFRLDSVQTSGQNLIWIGRCNRPVIGDVCSESVMKMSELSGYSWGTKEKYDSITITLRHTGDYQGDTMKAMTVNVLRLGQPLKFADNETAFYNVRTFKDSTSIGSFRFVPKPHSRPHLRYRLDDDFGMELRDFFIKYNGVASDVRMKAFEQFLGGIKIKAGDDSENLMAFRADSLKITLHSHLPGMSEIKYSRTMTMTESEKQYNVIWTENEDTPYETLKEDVSVSVTEDDGAQHSVMFEGLGYYTRINFKNLEDVVSRNQTSHVVKATLVMYPERGSYDKHNFPSTFYLWDINKGNVFQDAVTNIASSRVKGVLHKNLLDENDVYYTADITYYMNTLLSQDYIDENIGLALTWGTSMSPVDYNFMVFNGHTKTKYYSRLEIYYYNYDTEED